MTSLNIAPWGAAPRRTSTPAIPCAFAAHQPIRKVIHKSPRRVTYKFVSLKTGGSFGCESRNEFLFAHLAEACNDIAAIRAQPHRLHYTYGGVRHTYVPDFLVQLVGGRLVVVEVKPSRDAEDAENRALFDHLTKLYAQRGLTYAVVTDDVIGIEPRLTNSRMVCRYRFPGPTQAFALRLREAISADCPVTLGELACRLGLGADWLPALLRAAAHGLLSIDLSRPISEGTQVLAGGMSQWPTLAPSS